MRLAILSLVIGSLLAVGTLTAMIILALRSDMMLRFAHTLLALGFWIIITSSLMAVMFRFRLNRGVSWTAVAGLAAAMVLVLIVTPLSVFTRAFGPAEYDVPLVTGAATIGVCLILLMWLILRLRGG